MNITYQQKQIIESEENKIVVLSGAGCSKTFCMIERIKYLVRGGADPSKIVAITFTRNAAQEIISRLGDIKIYFCGTIHAFANYLLLCGGHDTSGYIQEEDFDGLFHELMKYPECIKKDISNLFLDEAQDSNSAQFEFIFDLLQPARWALFGDPKQCIYEFNGSEPWLLEEKADEPGVAVYYMTENFRNSRNILGYARSCLKYSKAHMTDVSQPQRTDIGEVIKIDYDLDELINIVKYTDEPKDWFILAFTNNEIDNLIDIFTRRGIPCDTFKQGEVSNTELKNKMNENTVKILTCHSSKGLENKNVAVLKFVENNEEKGRLFYVAATRAKDLLVVVARKPAQKKKREYKSWE